MAIKSDVAFNLGVYLSDASSVWNDKESAQFVTVDISSDFVVYTFNYEAAYSNWENIDLNMSAISHLGLVFNEGSGGEAVTGNISIDYIKISKTDIVGIVEVPSTTLFSTYPNPVTDMLYFNRSVDEFKIWDLSGKELNAFSTESGVSLGHLEPGIYIVTGKIEGTYFVRKILKD